MKVTWQGVFPAVCTQFHADYSLDVNAGGLYALIGNPNLNPETDLAVNLEAAVRRPSVDGFLAAVLKAANQADR